MSISAHRSQWIWTPVLGWALLSGGVCAALAQTTAVGTTAPGATDAGTAATGTGTGPTTTGPQAADPRSVLPGADIPAIDPSTGLPIVTNSSGINPTLTPTAPVAPQSTLPVITPQTNAAATITGPSITTLFTAPAANEVTTAPSYGTTIVNAPFGASIPTNDFLIGRGGGGSGPGDDELGITIGSFRLYPQIEVNAGADSNVFAQNASQGTVSSLYTTIAPALRLSSNWNNHELNIIASAMLGEYASAPTQNYQNYTLLANGKIDIFTDFFATWSIGYVQSTEALGTPNVSFAQAPTVDNSIPVALGLNQHIGRFFYEASVKATQYTFTDNSTITSTGLPASSRDRTEYDESLRLGYDLFPDLSIFVQPGINQRRYLNTTNSADQQRDSDGQLVSFGATWTTAETTKLETTVGYQNQVYQSTGATSSLTYGLSGSWNGYAPLTLRPTISRSISESALANFSSIVSTTYGIDFNYLIHDAWTGVGGVSVTTADYPAIPGSGATSRTDSLYRVQLGLLYALRPQIQIGPFFEYDQGTSTDPTNGAVYDREIFSIRLIAKR